jgi:hypothetical protein
MRQARSLNVVSTTAGAQTASEVSTSPQSRPTYIRNSTMTSGNWGFIIFLLAVLFYLEERKG